MAMDDQRFDTATRALAGATSRRLVLSGLVAAAAAFVGRSTVVAAKPKRGGKGKNGRGDSDATGLPGTQVGGIWDESIEVCHFDFETGDYRIITVSTPALPDYLNRGDTLFLDCCVDTDCEARVCLVTTGCIEGACAYDVTGGASCVTSDGASGTCDKEGTCVPAPVATGAVVS
jgi:hypothetical protein